MIKSVSFQAFVVISGVALLYILYKPVDFKKNIIYKNREKMALSPGDPSSYARPDLVKVTEIDLNLTADFEQHIFRGNVILSVEKVDPSATELILDVSDLIISSIKETNTNDNLEFQITDAVKDIGSKLTIPLAKVNKNTFKLDIAYESSTEASGLQWLDPEQTAGKKHPYLFSQFQAIHARSFVPCQDTPAVKTPYKATITAPKQFTVLMSAVRDDKSDKIVNENKVSHFIQKIPVPAYLIAIAIGDIQSRKIGPRSHVWAEKEIVDAAAFEFSETENQLKTAEDICGPYVWGTYDLLILPPSFPFGGMENPCLTFVTPTLLAGDKSLANVVAHEISHSWTGNLVTNRNFEQFWLNEGFTMFVERKIVGRLTNSSNQDFDALSGLIELKEAIKTLGENAPFTKLVVDLKGFSPDDSFSIVPYEKGHTFLRYLEQVVGGPQKFEPFLRKYFDTFKYKSIDTNDFKNFFTTYFASAPLNEIDWEKWLYGTGMPPVIPKYDTSLVDSCLKIVEAIQKWDGTAELTPSIDASSLRANELEYILQKLIEDSTPYTIQKLQGIEKLFALDKTNNSELKFRWLRISLKSQWMDKVPVVFEWINTVGRMKYVRPLYRDLYAWEEVRQRAIDNFNANKKNMMHVVAYTVSKDLHLQ